jgi:hypothetical protein
MHNTIWYAGKLCGFVAAIEDLDEAQAVLNSFRREGKRACAIHKLGAARIYVEGY